MKYNHRRRRRRRRRQQQKRRVNSITPGVRLPVCRPCKLRLRAWSRDITIWRWWCTVPLISVCLLGWFEDIT